MSKLSQMKSDTIGYISSIQTLLEKYPIASTTNSFSSIDGNVNSFDFIFDLLKIIGVDNTKLMEWFCNLLAGDDDGEMGLLSAIEKAVKEVLKLNIKNVLSCSVNPIIDDELLDQHNLKNPQTGLDISGTMVEGSGIEIDLGAIDLFGTLKMAPSSALGKYCYFDNEYSPNDMWKSKDFNVFLWYVINKGVYEIENEKSKMMWDNRNQFNSTTWNKSLSDGTFFKDEFLNESADEYNIDHKTKKKTIIQCHFSEREYPRNNKLIGQLSSHSYYKKRKVVGPLFFNKTIFEFNSDYIDSMKLFNSKVLVTQLVDKLTGSLAVDMQYSINELIIQGKIDAIVKKIIETEDVEVSDCYYTFTNEEYDQLLYLAELKHTGVYKYSGDIDTAISMSSEELLKNLTGITENSTLQEKTTVIKNTIMEVGATMAQDSSIYKFDKISFGNGLVYQLMRHLMTALVTSILSPKVMLLYYVNSKMLGRNLPDTLDGIFEQMGNLIVAIIKNIKNIILNELYNFLIEELKPLIELFAARMVLESVKAYKDLLLSLLETCAFGWNGNNNTVIGQIDNVNYADIIPTKTTPIDIIC